MGMEQHKAESRELEPLRCTVITVSDSRNLATDKSGQEMERHLRADGHEILERTVVQDDPTEIALVLRHWMGQDDVDVILLNGGTGVARRDGTVEVVRQFIERELSGFGELFRFLSYDQVGSAAMLSRALAGTARGKVIFSLPGSTKAVTLGMEKLIVPEVRHLVYELRK